MTSQLAALAAALMFSAIAVSAQAAAAAGAPAAATQPAPVRTATNDQGPDRLICKHQEEIGTRLGGHKACHTRAEWDDIAHRGGEVVNALQVLANHSNPSGH